MTRPGDELTMVDKYVLVFDFCSSTSIIEDLIRTESQKRWRDLLTETKRFLIKEREAAHGFEIYKTYKGGSIHRN
jgi:hypothetical protein